MTDGNRIIRGPFATDAVHCVHRILLAFMFFPQFVHMLLPFRDIPTRPFHKQVLFPIFRRACGGRVHNPEGDVHRFVVLCGFVRVCLSNAPMDVVEGSASGSAPRLINPAIIATAKPDAVDSM